jgi:hypothetical protein
MLQLHVLQHCGSIAILQLRHTASLQHQYIADVLTTSPQHKTLAPVIILSLRRMFCNGIHCGTQDECIAAASAASLQYECIVYLYSTRQYRSVSVYLIHISHSINILQLH